MTPEQLESNSQQGAQGQPTPDASGAGGSSTSTSDDLFARYGEQFRKIAREEAERAAQSTKDKRLGQIEKQLTDFAPILERVATLTNMSPEQKAQIQRDLEWDEMRKRVLYQDTGGNAAAPQSPSKTDPSLEVIKALDLDDNDPQVVAAVRDNENPVKLAVALANLKLSRASQPQPTPASIAAPASGSGGSYNASQVEGKITRYNELARNPQANHSEMVRLKKELDAVNWGQG